MFSKQIFIQVFGWSFYDGTESNWIKGSFHGCWCIKIKIIIIYNILLVLLAKSFTPDQILRFLRLHSLISHTAVHSFYKVVNRDDWSTYEILAAMCPYRPGFKTTSIIIIIITVSKLNLKLHFPIIFVSFKLYLLVSFSTYLFYTEALRSIRTH